MLIEMNNMNKSKLNVVASCIGIFLCMLDTTIMNIALPAIQTGLNVNLNDLSWALNIYTILFATLTIPLSKLSEKLGMHKFYVGGMIIFLLGSLISAFSSNITILIFGRAFQSLGAAVVFPLSMTIGISTVEISDRTKVIAALGVTQGLAAALGPLIGGVLTQFLSWRWIFLINIPLMIVSILICLYSLNFTELSKNIPIDLIGCFLSMICLFSLTIVLVQGRKWGWTKSLTLLLVILAVISFVIFIIYEKNIDNPMIPMSLFSDRQFNGAALTILLSNLFLVAVTVILPTYFTKIQGKTELYASLLITPITVMIFICSPIAAILIAKWGARLVIFVGFLAMFIAYVMLCKINMDNQLQVIAACAILGFGYGVITGPITVLAASDFTGEKLTASQSVAGVLRQVGVVLAIAIFVTGLYSNMKVAKYNSIEYAVAKIQKLDLSQKQKKVMIITTKNGIESGNPRKKYSKNHISSNIRKKIINAEYNRVTGYKKEINFTMRKIIKTQITQKVNRQLNVTNKKINHCIQGIQKYSKREFSKAFIKLYANSLPFLLTALLVSLVFNKKREL